VTPGETVQLLSNHFKFQTQNKANLIYIYNVEFGIFDDRDSRFDAIRSISDKLKSIYGVWMPFGRQIFSP
jgi:hypothetical protein